jgi:hypothetical protein
MKRIHLALVSLGVVMLAAGCGGGGSSGGGTSIPTAAVQITPANAPVVAKGAVTPAQSMVNTGSGMAGVVGVVAQTSGHSRSVLEISLAEFNRARNLILAPSVAGVVRSATVNCTTSGTVTGSLQDTNNNNSFDVNEILTLTFNNCVEPTTAGNSTTTNGRATFAITQLTGTKSGASPSTPFTAAFRLTFSNYTSRDNVTNLSINGDINFSTLDDGASTTGTMSGTSLRMTSSVDGAFLMTSYNFSFMETNAPNSPYSFSVTMTIASTVANGSVTVTTPIPFTGQGIDDPTVGEMLIAGANSSTLTITAIDNVNVQLVVDEDGPGPMPPATPIDTTWAAL